MTTRALSTRLLGAGFALALLQGTLAHAYTLGTFADPALDGSTPLFTIAAGQITGGWSDAQTGLDLEFPVSSTVYADAWFMMDPLSYVGGPTGATVGSGTIRFFADGMAPTSTPLLQIDFNSASLTFGTLGGDNIFSGSQVAFSGSEVPANLAMESSAFSFANQTLLPGSNGFTTTASFTSSAVPEPATLAFMLIGLLGLRKRR